MEMSARMRWICRDPFHRTYPRARFARDIIYARLRSEQGVPLLFPSLLKSITSRHL